MSFHATYEAVVGGLRSAIPIAELLAATTTNVSWDDDLVKFAKTILNNQALLQWFHDLICRHPEVVVKTGAERDLAIHAAMEAEAPAGGPIRTLFEQIGVAWETAKAYVPSILRLLFTVLGYRS